jgi:hypothetical protein
MADRNRPPLDSDPLAFSRAEWLPQEALFAWFRRPNYFPELETPTPCVLVGGRGTGKTTVLRCLSYEGRAALHPGRPNDGSSWRYFGLYHRINSNRVRAFRGAGLSDEQWTPLFAHYINLLLAEKYADFLLWYETSDGRPLVFSPEFYEDIAVSLRLKQIHGLREFKREVGKSLREFEIYLNDMEADTRPKLSIQGAPIDLLSEFIATHPAFAGRHFFIIIDEFENLLDYQQVVFNTLIKHSTNRYSFKIGVRELGWRVKHTSNLDESLSSPADYSLIDINTALSGDAFASFAEAVCNTRTWGSASSGPSIAKSFPSLSLEDEAERLGLRRLTSKLQSSYVGRHSELVHTMRPLELYFADSWAEQTDHTLEQILDLKFADDPRWLNRYNNYAYSLLFGIRRGRPGIRKYYSGWKTFCLLADGNIRFLLELVYQAKILHSRSGGKENAAISAEHQTEAAIAVGRKYLEELPGTSVLGGQMTKLLLSLGRVFEVMAAKPEGHAPEVNQVHIEGSDVPAPLSEILDSAVMNLGLVRSTANKRSSNTPETKEFDYSIHPVYSAFFCFSHRRKRKMRISPHQLRALIETPSDGIEELLRQTNRMEPDALPEQLKLFAGFYGDA